MANDFFTGFAVYISILIAGHLYFLGSIFECFAVKYKRFPIEANRLFDTLGNYRKRWIAVMYFEVPSNFEQSTLLQRFVSASRLEGIFWIIVSSIYITIMMVFLWSLSGDGDTLFEQLNYGFWLITSIVTIAFVLRAVRKLVRLHKTLQASIHANSTPTNVKFFESGVTEMFTPKEKQISLVSFFGASIVFIVTVFIAYLITSLMMGIFNFSESVGFFVAVCIVFAIQLSVLWLVMRLMYPLQN